MSEPLDAVDRRIVNGLQGGFPICERPFAEAAAGLDMTEAALLDRVRDLLSRRVLSRFGPLYNAEHLGGAVTLVALAVPEDRFDAVAETVNAFPEVAHNYRRDHRFNMWFVVACDAPERIPQVIAEIENATGLEAIDLPKEEEFFLDLRLTA